MLSELLQKLEGEHGIDPSQGQNILNTIAAHIKESFPMVGGMLDNVLGSNASTAQATNTAGAQSTSAIGNQGGGALEQLEDLAKSKLGGLFGGGKI